MFARFLKPGTLGCVSSHYFLINCSRRYLDINIRSRNHQHARHVTNDRNSKRYLAIAAGCGILWWFYQSIPEVSSESLGKDNKEWTSTQHISKAQNSPRKTFNFIASVVEDVAPAVVYIEIKSNLRSPNFHFQHGPQTISNGSGFIIKNDGLIVTNAHVVLGNPNSTVQVKLYDGRIFVGTVESIDMKSDLATVKINCDNLPTLKLGSSSDVKPGEWVVAVGSPLSLANTITTGVVSSINRGSTELGLQGKDMEYIQTDAAITFGNSGGPLINLDGEVVGVNAMKVTAGISFAIPIDYVKLFLKSLEQKKAKEDERWFSSWKDTLQSSNRKSTDQQSNRQYLGVTLLTLTPQLFTELQMRGTELSSTENSGVLIWKVVLGSPAHHGGLQPGDIIVAIDDQPICSSQDVYKILEVVDQSLKVTIVRKREKINFVINFENDLQ